MVQRRTRAARKRRYRLRRRAEKQEETRRRIVEAAMELHGSIGVRRTTMSAIAELAGVQRNTLYSYFPDENAVGAACSALWYERNPFPDQQALKAIADPVERLRATIEATYAYFDRAHGMLESLSRDMDLPLVWEAAAPLREAAQARRDLVVRAFGLRGARRERLEAAVELALDFETWRTLVQRRSMDRPAVVELLVAMVQAVCT